MSRRSWAASMAAFAVLFAFNAYMALSLLAGWREGETYRGVLWALAAVVIAVILVRGARYRRSIRR